ncbi:hypothetical protein M7I_1402 [Glarea lozoyensis 74030]|nr:hypothetical protein M7I_1402 [Glarea lozoyensis 74030]
MDSPQQFHRVDTALPLLKRNTPTVPVFLSDTQLPVRLNQVVRIDQDDSVMTALEMFCPEYGVSMALRSRLQITHLENFPTRFPMTRQFSEASKKLYGNLTMSWDSIGMRVDYPIPKDIMIPDGDINFIGLMANPKINFRSFAEELTNLNIGKIVTKQVTEAAWVHFLLRKFKALLADQQALQRGVGIVTQLVALKSEQDVSDMAKVHLNCLLNEVESRDAAVYWNDASDSNPELDTKDFDILAYQDKIDEEDSTCQMLTPERFFKEYPSLLVENVEDVEKLLVGGQ